MKREPFASSSKILLFRAVCAAALKAFILSAAWLKRDKGPQGLQVEVRRVGILFPASLRLLQEYSAMSLTGEVNPWKLIQTREPVYPCNIPCDCYGQCEHHVPL